MALTRKFLAALGLSDTQVESIIDAHSETVSALKAELEERDKKINGFADSQKKIDEYKEKIKSLTEEQKSNNQYKVLYEETKKDFDEYKQGEELKATKAKKEDAYKSLLLAAGISEKRIASVMKVSGDTINALEFDEDGKTVKNSDKLIESAKTDWSDFITKKSEKAVETKENVNGSNNGGKSLTKDEIMDIKDTRKRQEAWKQYLLEKQND